MDEGLHFCLSVHGVGGCNHLQSYDIYASFNKTLSLLLYILNLFNYNRKFVSLFSVRRDEQMLRDYHYLWDMMMENLAGKNQETKPNWEVEVNNPKSLQSISFNFFRTENVMAYVIKGSKTASSESKVKSESKVYQRKVAVSDVKTQTEEQESLQRKRKNRK